MFLNKWIYIIFPTLCMTWPIFPTPFFYFSHSFFGVWCALKVRDKIIKNIKKGLETLAWPIPLGVCATIGMCKVTFTAQIYDKFKFIYK